MRRKPLSISVSLLVLLASVVAAQAPPGTLQYSGMCDASAAVAVGDGLFVVANDEDNVLRIYRSREGGGPVSSFDMDRFLDVEPEHPEADIEGAARIGDRIYWIASHGRNKGAKERPNRRRLFATDVREAGGRVTLAGAGTPYRDLLRDLEKDPDLDEFKLDKAAGRAPEDEDGLNIEGLAATPQGHLLIGFRNPIRKGRALLVPLENPDEVVRGKTAKLGEPIVLDLGRRGVRSIEHRPSAGAYLIVAGAAGDRRDFRLFRWSGDRDDTPREIPGVAFGSLNPEALLLAPEGGRERVLVLSDDGGPLCQGLAVADRRFRGAPVTP